ncbi:MAG: hypothetical protein HFE66_01325 [Clostridiales bacterium]|jgi:hypothetical protein|nr:hypothetical protein [Clostridiales bacterium]
MLLDVLYINFSLQNSTMSLTVIIWGLYAGMLVGGILSVYNKRYLGGVARALLETESLTPEHAKTLGELGLSSKWGRRRALQDGKVLRKCIAVANADECRIPVKTGKKWIRTLRRFFTGSAEKKPKLDVDRARLYVLEEKKYHAHVRYTKKGTSPVFILVGGILLLVIAILATIFIPELLELTDNMISAWKDL